MSNISFAYKIQQKFTIYNGVETVEIRPTPIL